MFCMFFITNLMENLGRPKEKFLSLSLLHIISYVKDKVGHFILPVQKTKP